MGMVGARSAALLASAILAACSTGSLILGRLDETAPLPSSDAGVLTDGSTNAAVCEPPAPARHYTFDGIGTDVVDALGGPPGRVLGGATLDGSGVLHLDGVDDYVDLPNGILASLDEVTIALWIRYLGRPAYTRIFDFGSSSIGEDPPDGTPHGGKTYLALTPATGFVPSGVALLMSRDGPAGETFAATDVALEREQLRMLVVVVARDTLSLFYGAELVTRVPRTIPLSAIDVQNAWLGRSQYDADPRLEGDYADLRIYGRALSDCAVAALERQGPP